MRVLLIKTSSLGDVVHALPAVNDAVEAEFEIDWVVEEAFSEIAELHSGVSKVIPVAWRRWRKSLFASLNELKEFKGELSSKHYDICLDSQGLIKSSLWGLVSDSDSRVGFDYGSAREPLVSLLYHKKILIPKDLHAIDRQRELFSQALNYRFRGESNPGINKSGQAKRQIFLLHGTTWESKRWPLDHWRTLVEKAKTEGLDVLVSWGNEFEQVDAEKIVEGSGATLLPKMALKQLAVKLSESQIVVGVDTGLVHLSAALGVPTLGLYGPTSVELTGCRGPRADNLKSISGMEAISPEMVWSRIQRLGVLASS